MSRYLAATFFAVLVAGCFAPTGESRFVALIERWTGDDCAQRSAITGGVEKIAGSKFPNAAEQSGGSIREPEIPSLNHRKSPAVSQQIQTNQLAKSIKLDQLDLPLVCVDDFQSGISKWETTDSKAWELREQATNKFFALKSRISKYVPEHRSPHNIALLKNTPVKDFVLTFDVRSPKDTGDHRDCCVFFGYLDKSKFYYAHLGAKPDPHSGQIMIVHDAPRKAVTQNANSIRWSNQWHKVKTTRNSLSGEIKVYFDDMQNPLMTTTDRTFGNGLVGIGSFDDMNDFDNVVLHGR